LFKANPRTCEAIVKMAVIQIARSRAPGFLTGVFALMVCLISPIQGAETSGLRVAVVPSDQLPPVIDRPYEIQVGDELEVNFFKVSDLNQERTVGPDGEIFLTLIGKVEVRGRSVDDVTTELNERYSKEMVNPQITLSIREFSGLKVYVSGEVNEPGIVTYQGKLTLVQALMEAGGHNDRARLKEVLLIRRGPDNQPVGTLINVKSILRRGTFTDDVQLAPLDTIYVHHKRIVDVNLFVEQYISNNIPDVKGWYWWIQD
jgi:protein involved in polysaccharide export with SLBB domain